MNGFSLMNSRLKNVQKICEVGMHVLNGGRLLTYGGRLSRFFLSRVYSLFRGCTKNVEPRLYGG